MRLYFQPNQVLSSRNVAGWWTGLQPPAQSIAYFTAMISDRLQRATRDTQRRTCLVRLVVVGATVVETRATITTLRRVVEYRHSAVDDSSRKRERVGTSEPEPVENTPHSLTRQFILVYNGRRTREEHLSFSRRVQCARFNVNRLRGARR